MKSLTGKVAWITGAGTGIGLAGAQALAQAGAVVVMSGRRHEVLVTEAAALNAAGGTAEVELLDVSDPAAGQARGPGHRGSPREDRHPAQQRRHEFTRPVLEKPDGGRLARGDWHQSRWFVPHHPCRAAKPCARAAHGLVINVSSWAGVHHPKLTGPAYNAAKHAVTAMTETINMEEGVNGIRACALCPAEVATPILDRRPVPPSAQDRARMLQPRDLGGTIRFIAELPNALCVSTS